jgi:hypothetical protein
MLLDSTMQWKEEFDEAKKDGICQKLIKADFNGAHIQVVNCKNKQMIG